MDTFLLRVKQSPSLNVFKTRSTTHIFSLISTDTEFSYNFYIVFFIFSWNVVKLWFYFIQLYFKLCFTWFVFYCTALWSAVTLLLKCLRNKMEWNQITKLSAKSQGMNTFAGSYLFCLLFNLFINIYFWIPGLRHIKV